MTKFDRSKNKNFAFKYIIKIEYRFLTDKIIELIMTNILLTHLLYLCLSID